MRPHMNWTWPLAIAIAAIGVSAPTGRAQETADGKMKVSWDAVYMSGTKIGTIQTTVERLKDPTKDRDLFRVNVTMDLTFKRKNDRVRQQVRYGTLETVDGSVLRLDVRILAGENEVRSFGDVIENKLTLNLDGGGQRQQNVLDWGPEVRGPHAPEQSLARAPLKVGETREEKMFIPSLNRIGTVKLIGEKMETIELGGRVKRELLKVQAPVFAPDGKEVKDATATLWVDESGQVLKQFTDTMGGITIYRTTESAAKAPAGELDLIAEQIVRVPRKLPNPEKTRAIVYEISVKGEDVAELFPADRRQKTRPGRQAGTTVLEVRTAGPKDGEAGSESVDEEYLKPNPWINSDDARVIAHMKRAVGNATDPWAKAVAIQRWVHRNIRAKNFARGFDNASEVARNLSGDCTEHSVLTAAMCRAAGIPTRVAIGLVYGDQLGGFGYHMWNEVYVNRRWVALDAAFDQSEVDAVHLKLSDSSLQGTSPFESMQSVGRVFKKLSLRPLEIR